MLVISMLGEGGVSQSSAYGRSTPASSEIEVDQPVGANQLVSVRPDGEMPQRSSYAEAVSASGRYVLFSSYASRLIGRPRCAPETQHVYLRDRRLGVTSLVDVGADGKCLENRGTALSISGDGRFVVYASEAPPEDPEPVRSDIYVLDRTLQTTTKVTVDKNGGRANGPSFYADISADGSTVVFDSYATDLIPGPRRPPLEWRLIYRRDLESGTTTLVSKTSTGAFPDEGSADASISRDGNLIAYSTRATDIVAGGYCCPAANVMLYDFAADRTTLVSRPPTGLPNSFSSNASISADGNVVVYGSEATNLVPDDTNRHEDLFLYDVEADLTTGMVTRSRSGGSTNGDGVRPEVNGDGTYVAYGSFASNVVPGDDNETLDVFVTNTATGVTLLASHTPSGSAADSESWVGGISDDGSIVAYHSDADDILPFGPSRRDQVYAYRVR